MAVSFTSRGAFARGNLTRGEMGKGKMGKGESGRHRLTQAGARFGLLSWDFALHDSLNSKMCHIAARLSFHLLFKSSLQTSLFSWFNNTFCSPFRMSSSFCSSSYIIVVYLCVCVCLRARARVCVCVCVCVTSLSLSLPPQPLHDYVWQACYAHDIWTYKQ